jgi:hypothetical protein
MWPIKTASNSPPTGGRALDSPTAFPLILQPLVLLSSRFTTSPRSCCWTLDPGLWTRSYHSPLTRCSPAVDSRHMTDDSRLVLLLRFTNHCFGDSTQPSAFSSQQLPTSAVVFHFSLLADSGSLTVNCNASLSCFKLIAECVCPASLPPPH